MSRQHQKTSLCWTVEVEACKPTKSAIGVGGMNSDDVKYHRAGWYLDWFQPAKYCTLWCLLSHSSLRIRSLNSDDVLARQSQASGCREHFTYAIKFSEPSICLRFRNSSTSLPTAESLIAQAFSIMCDSATVVFWSCQSEVWIRRRATPIILVMTQRSLAETTYHNKANSTSVDI